MRGLVELEDLLAPVRIRRAVILGERDYRASRPVKADRSQLGVGPPTLHGQELHLRVAMAQLSEVGDALVAWHDDLRAGHADLPLERLQAPREIAAAAEHDDHDAETRRGARCGHDVSLSGAARRRLNSR